MIRTIRTLAASTVIGFHAGAILIGSTNLFLFGRKKDRPTRADAYQDLFGAIAGLYESAAALKPAWRDQWVRRSERDLPPKYQIGDDLLASGANDMRFAVTLLQTNRWKSRVQPLFEDVDHQAWEQFREAAAEMSRTLLEMSDAHADRLAGDEQDWIVNAVQEFDDATRRRRVIAENGAPLSRQVAEGVYQPVYIAIHLSDRLIERRRHEMEENQ